MGIFLAFLLAVAAEPTVEPTAEPIVVKVGDQVLIKTFITPSVLEVDDDGNPILGTMPEPPYVYDILIPKEYVKYRGAGGSAISDYVVNEDSPYDSVKVTSNASESTIYLWALKVTDSPIVFPVESVTGNGVPINLNNKGTLTIDGREATMWFVIERVEME